MMSLTHVCTGVFIVYKGLANTIGDLYTRVAAPPTSWNFNNARPEDDGMMTSGRSI